MLGDLARKGGIGPGKGPVRGEKVIGRHVQLIGEQEGRDFIEQMAARLLEYIASAVCERRFPVHAAPPARAAKAKPLQYRARRIFRIGH